VVLKLTIALDLVGTFVFALSGAMAGIKHRLDLFGVLVLSFAAATSGGIARDVFIGALPPASISDWRYIAIPALAGLVAFYWHPIVERLQASVLLFDAAGLSLFAVSGALKALVFHLGPVSAAILGMATGIGGGIVRDLLVAEIPTVLKGEIYALAALAGAGVVVVGSLLRLPAHFVSAAGFVSCFALRWVAIRRGWRLPKAVQPRRGDPPSGRSHG
jgi:uncharacterized membrane protein YeiH